MFITFILCITRVRVGGAPERCIAIPGCVDAPGLSCEVRILPARGGTDLQHGANGFWHV